MSVLIQVASFSVQLDARTRRGPVAFSLTNTGAEAAALRLVPLALSPELGGCLTPDPAQVTLAPGTTTMVQMHVAAPGLLAAGDYLVRLSLVPVAGGGGVSSSDVTVIVPEHAAGPLADARPRPFPWWVVIVGAVVALVIGLVLWLTLGREGEPDKPPGDPATVEAAPAESAPRPPVRRVEAESATPDRRLEKEPERAVEATRVEPHATAAEAARAEPEKPAAKPDKNEKNEKTVKPAAEVRSPGLPPTSRPTTR